MNEIKYQMWSNTKWTCFAVYHTSIFLPFYAEIKYSGTAILLHDFALMKNTGSQLIDFKELRWTRYL
jgi:hypothetical protein